MNVERLQALLPVLVSVATCAVIIVINLLVGIPLNSLPVLVMTGIASFVLAPFLLIMFQRFRAH